jgi:hypothetical protein
VAIAFLLANVYSAALATAAPAVVQPCNSILALITLGSITIRSGFNYSSDIEMAVSFIQRSGVAESKT